MFDRLIYTILDTIVDWCERYKEYKIHKTLPKACFDENVRKQDIKKWVDGQEKSYK